MTKTNARRVVLDILMEYNESDHQGILAGLLIRDTLKKYAFLPYRDRAFIKKLSECTIERRITLDYIIDLFSSVKTDKMKPLIREVLRMGVCQLYFMDKVPPRAVCSESVKLVKSRHMGSLSGFVNAVLRAVSSSKPDIDKIDNLSIRYSIPEWIVERFQREFSGKAPDILRASVGEKPLYIRTNLSLISPDKLKETLQKEGARVKEAGSFGYAFEVNLPDAISQMDSFQDGLYSVQDLTSMYVGDMALRWIKEKFGENSVDQPLSAARARREKETDKSVSHNTKYALKVLDLCSAPGGKICHIAESFQNIDAQNVIEDNSSVDTGCAPRGFFAEARDISDKKTALIQENIERLRLLNVKTKVWDATVFDESLENSCDIVICDLPCSGLGVLARRGDLKYRLKPSDIEELSALQKLILKNAVRYVKTSCLLIFSTCTITHEETIDQSLYLEREFALKKLHERLFLPKFGGHDGFYAAEFEKL